MGLTNPQVSGGAAAGGGDGDDGCCGVEGEAGLEYQWGSCLGGSVAWWAPHLTPVRRGRWYCTLS